MYVGSDALEWIVFCDGDVFEGGGMNDVINAPKRHFEAFSISYISDEIPHDACMLREEAVILHLKLLQLIARQND